MDVKFLHIKLIQCYRHDEYLYNTGSDAHVEIIGNKQAFASLPSDFMKEIGLDDDKTWCKQKHGELVTYEPEFQERGEQIVNAFWRIGKYLRKQNGWRMVSSGQRTTNGKTSHIHQPSPYMYDVQHERWEKY